MPRGPGLPGFAPARCSRKLFCIPTDMAPMATTNNSDADAATELILKTIAPRAPQHLLTRARLGVDEPRLRNLQIALVQAPAGYGKTSLLAQWRREHLAHGVAVAWLSVD